MVEWKLVFSKQAHKDAKKLKEAGLKKRAEYILEILRLDPFQDSPPYEKLVGDLSGAYSRRINIKHRLIYQIHEKEKTIKVIRMWTHYE